MSTFVGAPNRSVTGSSLPNLNAGKCLEHHMNSCKTWILSNVSVLPQIPSSLHGKQTKRERYHSREPRHYDGTKCQSSQIVAYDGDTYSCGSCSEFIASDKDVYIGNINAY
eukprot:4477621-Pleurochrysis_carterae.AAC.1